MLPLTLPLHYLLISFSLTAIRRQENEEKRETAQAEKGSKSAWIAFRIKYASALELDADLLIGIEIKKLTEFDSTFVCSLSRTTPNELFEGIRGVPEAKIILREFFCVDIQIRFSQSLSVLLDDFMSAHCIT